MQNRNGYNTRRGGKKVSTKRDTPTEPRTSIQYKIRSDLGKVLYRYNSWIQDNELTLDRYNLTQPVTLYNTGQKCFIYITKLGNKDIMYFFGEHNEFYISISPTFTESPLVIEGYMSMHGTYTATDLLIYRGNPVQEEYETRRELLYNLLSDKPLSNLNNKINIVTYSDSANLTSITAGTLVIESVQNFKKTIELRHVQVSPRQFLIKPENTVDIYTICELDTNNTIGILYVKSMDDSRRMSCMFQNKSSLVLDCSYNERFNKWQAIIESEF